ncbi:MAG TPA: hypothetical protein VNZ94_00465 [Xanthobacteraceae bacterium]|nr:hypothetical protein [Xanthobacteraceae bacterium]
MTERLPKPWTIVEHSESFEVQASNGVGVAYVYFEDEEIRRGLLKRMSKALALRVAKRIAAVGE